RLCTAVGGSRSGYYRYLKPGREKEGEMGLRGAVQKEGLEMAVYGYRRGTAGLRRRGWGGNNKRGRRPEKKGEVPKSWEAEVCANDGNGLESARLSEPGK